MRWIRALAPALVAGCAAVVSLGVVAQATPAAVRGSVDARAMAPGPQASDAASESAPAPASALASASGLTRNQRKEAALQARQDGVLQPAGEAADGRGDKAALASTGRFRSTALPIPPPQTPSPSVAADASPSPIVADASPPAKKISRKKARAASAPPG